MEEPTVRMSFGVNTSPFAGREGKFVTSRNIKVPPLTAHTHAPPFYRLRKARPKVPR